jgi:hypothetical protein
VHIELSAATHEACHLSVMVSRDLFSSLTGVDVFSRPDDASHSLTFARFSTLGSLHPCTKTIINMYLVDECEDSKEGKSVSKRANAKEWLASSGHENAPTPVKELI